MSEPSRYKVMFADTLIEILIGMLERHPLLDSEDYDELLELASQYYVPITARYKRENNKYLVQVGTPRSAVCMGISGFSGGGL